MKKRYLERVLLLQNDFYSHYLFFKMCYKSKALQKYIQIKSTKRKILSTERRECGFTPNEMKQSDNSFNFRK